MSQYSNAQTATKLEQTASSGSGGNSESLKPVEFDGKSEKGGGAKLGAVTAGHSPKIGNGGMKSKSGSKVEE